MLFETGTGVYEIMDCGDGQGRGSFRFFPFVHTHTPQQALLIPSPFKELSTSIMLPHSEMQH